MAVYRFITIIIAYIILSGSADACTSAVISGRVTANGRPLLWKHRDTSHSDNKVERIAATDSTFEYVALFNAGDSGCREAWVGYNSRGFAVMNTAVYNLKDDTVSVMDREGLLMSEALKHCTTVDDFEDLLQRLPKPLGVEANFGVIDACGNGAYFETGNYGYTKFDLDDDADGVMVRTNYAHSGREGEGMGYEREKNAICQLSSHAAAGDISAELLTEVLSKRFYSSRRGKDISFSEETVVTNQEFIPRYTSTATVVIEGVVNGESPLLTTMWVGLGYPPCAEIRAVWIDENEVPAELRGTGARGHAPLCDAALDRKRNVFLKEKRADLAKLYNRSGTGYCQILAPLNREAYRKGYEAIARKRKLLHDGNTVH